MAGARIASGAEVTFRTVEREDVPFLQRAFANPELRYPLGWEVKSRSDLEGQVDDHLADGHRFIVCVDGDEAGPGNPAVEAVTRVGYVEVGEIGNRRPGIGFWIAPSEQGQGYGREAVTMLLDFAFREAPIPGVRTEVLPGNEPSRHVIESLGFTLEGRLRRAAFWDGEYRDTLVYGLLRDEWQGSE